MEQNIGILFVAIGLLSASIGILEKNYMFGVDSYVDKFNKKYKGYCSSQHFLDTFFEKLFMLFDV